MNITRNQNKIVITLKPGDCFNVVTSAGGRRHLIEVTDTVNGITIRTENVNSIKEVSGFICKPERSLKDYRTLTYMVKDI
ncbi:hypothetical protein HOC90_00545 [Candidatus Falkowbacteria bacterium]|jgi:hypothetical protein|nr:hypothetical protein [Candidatus Falkowbacteria bacterium]